MLSSNKLKNSNEIEHPKKSKKYSKKQRWGKSQFRRQRKQSHRTHQI